MVDFFKKSDNLDLLFLLILKPLSNENTDYVH